MDRKEYGKLVEQIYKDILQLRDAYTNICEALARLEKPFCEQSIKFSEANHVVACNGNKKNIRTWFIIQD